MAADIGQGVYVTFSALLSSNTASTSAYKITGVNHNGISRAVADATHMLSSAKEYVASTIYDPGEVSVEVLHDPTVRPFSDMTNVATNQVVSVYWANGGTNVALWSAFGYMTGYEAGAQMEDMMSGTVTIKLSGAMATASV